MLLPHRLFWRCYRGLCIEHWHSVLCLSLFFLLCFCVVLQYRHHDKGRIKEKQRVHDQVSLVPQAAPELQQARAGQGAPHDRKKSQDVSEGLQVDQVHDKDLDQRQRVDGQESVTHDAGDGPETDGIVGTDQVHHQGHGDTPEKAVDVDEAELELSCQHHLGTQQQQDGDRSREVAVFADHPGIDLVATETGKGKDNGLGFEQDVLDVDAQFFQERGFVIQKRIRRVL
mmetsp:Transcript_7087/g.17108  ORF Transcript_7087/g.17108 Transcript_7087/m.17108 type:complete len:228 (+) Transcript_7087:257-940(+)